jgi:Arc/MetJ family transcription regulator
VVDVGQRGPAPKAASTSLILSSHTFSPPDEDLVETAKELTGARFTKDVVDLALRRLVRNLRRQRILQLAGKVRWEGGGADSEIPRDHPGEQPAGAAAQRPHRRDRADNRRALMDTKEFHEAGHRMID